MTTQKMDRALKIHALKALKPDKIDENVFADNIKNIKPIILDRKSNHDLNLLLSKIQNTLAERRYYRQVHLGNVLLEDLIAFFNGGGILTLTLIKKVTDFLKTKISQHDPNTFIHNIIIGSKITTLINNGLRFEMIDPAFTLLILTIGTVDINKILSDINFTFDYKFITNANLEDIDDQRLKKLFDHKIKLKFTKDEINKYLCSEYSDEYIISILLDDHNVNITRDITNNIAKYYTLNILKQIILCGGIMDHEVLENACMMKTYHTNVGTSEKIKFILENKIIPTQKAFDNILNNSKKTTEQNNFKYNRLKNSCNNNAESSKSIQLFIDYGYNLTYENLLDALKYNIIINNIENYNFVFDSKYLEICSQIGLYPYKTNVKANLKCLEFECKKNGNLVSIRKMINDNKLIPNEACLHAACSNKGNLQTIKFLVAKGGKIDFKCLENIINVNYNTNTNYILTEFKKNNPDFDKNNNVKEIINNNVKNNNKNDKKNDSNDITDDDHVEYTNSDPDNDYDNGNNDDNDDNNDEDDEDDDNADNIINTDNTDNESKDENKMNIKSVKSVKIANIRNQNGITNNIDIKTCVSKIPEDYNVMSIVYDKIPIDIRKLLKITTSNKTLNFIDFRNFMMNYLNTSKMIINKVIKLKKPYLYNGDDNVTFSEINNWIYSLLIDDTKINKTAKTIVKKNKKINSNNASDNDENDEENNDENNDNKNNNKITSIMDINETSEGIMQSRRARRIIASQNKNEKIITSNKIKKIKSDNHNDNENDEQNNNNKISKKKVIQK